MKKAPRNRTTKAAAKAATFEIRNDFVPIRQHTRYVYDSFQLDKLKIGHSIHVKVNTPMFQSTKGVAAKYNKINENSKVSHHVIVKNDKEVEHVIYKQY